MVIAKYCEVKVNVVDETNGIFLAISQYSLSDFNQHLDTMRLGDATHVEIIFVEFWTLDPLGKELTALASGSKIKLIIKRN